MVVTYSSLVKLKNFVTCDKFVARMYFRIDFHHRKEMLLSGNVKFPCTAAFLVGVLKPYESGLFQLQVVTLNSKHTLRNDVDLNKEKLVEFLSFQRKLKNISNIKFAT